MHDSDVTTSVCASDKTDSFSPYSKKQNKTLRHVCFIDPHLLRRHVNDSVKRNIRHIRQKLKGCHM